MLDVEKERQTMKLPNCAVFELCSVLPLKHLAKFYLSSENCSSLAEHKIQRSQALAEDLDFETLKEKWQHGTLEEVDVSRIFREALLPRQNSDKKQQDPLSSLFLRARTV